MNGQRGFRAPGRERQTTNQSNHDVSAETMTTTRTCEDEQAEGGRHWRAGPSSYPTSTTRGARVDKRKREKKALHIIIDINNCINTRSVLARTTTKKVWRWRKTKDSFRCIGMGKVEGFEKVIMYIDCRFDRLSECICTYT